MSTDTVQVIKIELNNELKRFNFPKTDSLSFGALEDKIRVLFNLNPDHLLRISYTDEDGDIISLSSDDELKDALILQGLNPLRVKVESLLPEKKPNPAVNKPFEKAFQKSFQNCDKAVQDVLNEFQNTISTSIKLADSTVKDVREKIGPIVQAGPQNLSKVMDAINESGLKNIIGSKHAPTSVPSKPQPAAAAAAHYGVECDVCGANPITGNRYKSTVKNDYDLCEACFGKESSQNEYTKIEQPPFFRRGGTHGCRRGMRGFPPFGFRPFGGGRGHFHGSCPRPTWQQEGKYDARFVKDVSVFDGTEMPPGTSFTKIWRLRNSGTMVWPRQLQLIHVGGDKLGNVDQFPIEISEQGVAPEEETEISVDLISPLLPGRYVSHWRLCLPGGMRFGHRFWVLIQVVAAGEQSPQFAESLQNGSASSQPNPEPTPNQTQTEPATDAHQPTENSPLRLEDIIASATDAAISAAACSTGNAAATASFLAAVASSIPPSTISSIVSSLYPNVYPRNASASSFDFNTSAAPVTPTAPTAPTVPTVPSASAFTSSAPASTATATVVTESIPSAPPMDAVLSPLVTASASLYPTVSVPVESDFTVKLEEKPIADKSVQTLETEKGKTILDGYDHVGQSDLSESFVVVNDAEYAAEVQKRAEVGDKVQQLVAMGFADKAVDMEMLKKNEFDLQTTLDDLVKLDQWSSSFLDLEEMGFNDGVLNRALMLKYDGVIKRVVKELVDLLEKN